MSKAIEQFFVLTKYDYQEHESTAYTSYEEAVAVGTANITERGAWSFKIEKRWVNERMAG